jgi:hypothetical protein
LTSQAPPLRQSRDVFGGTCRIPDRKKYL